MISRVSRCTSTTTTLSWIRLAMFFEIFILQKKGPLGILSICLIDLSIGVIWLASHYEKRLSKSNVLETDLPRCTGQIVSPKAQFACRYSECLELSRSI
jgi:hypothetical protein